MPIIYQWQCTFINPCGGHCPFINPCGGHCPFINPYGGHCPFINPCGGHCLFINPCGRHCPFINPSGGQCPFINPCRGHCPFINLCGGHCPFINPCGGHCPFINSCGGLSNSYLNGHMLSREAACTILMILFGVTWSGCEPTTYSMLTTQLSWHSLLVIKFRLIIMHDFCLYLVKTTFLIPVLIAVIFVVWFGRLCLTSHRLRCIL